MTLIHRANTTAVDVISNITAGRFTNLTAQWGGYLNNTTGPPNWGTSVWDIVSIYPDAVGIIAWVILFGMPFIMMWITHADLVPTAIVGFLFGIYVFAYVGSSYQLVGVLFMAIAATTIIYSLAQKRG